MKNLLAVLLLFLTLTLFAQTNYYVSPAGNDDNAGTSPSYPWLSIQKAIDNATHGDTIFLMGGTYSQETVFITDKRTTSSSYLVITNYPTHTPVIDGSGLGSDPQLFYIENANNIVIENLVLKNNQRNNAAGIDIEGNCQNIKILNNEITQINFSSNPDDVATSSDNAYPVIVYASDGTNANTGIVISGNTVHDCRTGWSEGIAMNGNVDGFEISGNIVYNITNIGIDAIGFEGTAPQNDFARNGIIKNNTVHNCISPYAECGGIYIDGGQNIIVENNLSYQNQYGIEVGNEHTGTVTANITVRNNVFHTNQNMGILVGGYNGNVQYVTVTGNTTYGNNTGGDWGAELYFSEKCSDITVKNNIFYANNTQNIIVLAEGADTEPANLTLDYNLYCNAGGENAANFDWFGDSYDGLLADFQKSGHDANSFFADPKLANVSGADFHLTATSPAINAGDPGYTPAAGETDMDGNPRVFGGRVDIGAYEYQGSATSISSPAGPQIFPNPAYDRITVTGIENSENIRLLDINGHLLRSYDPAGSRITIKIDDLPPGIYFIRIKGNNSTTLPLVKR